MIICESFVFFPSFSQQFAVRIYKTPIFSQDETAESRILIGFRRNDQIEKKKNSLASIGLTN